MKDLTNITPEKLLVIMLVGIVLILGVVLLLKKKPRKLKSDMYLERWREIQSLLKDKKQWPMAVLNADALLDEVLKKRKVRGSSMGERMVKVQKKFSDHDAVWAAHKLRNKIAHGELKMPNQEDVKSALLAIRQALKDIGALK
jgi:hypothetical protein